MDRDVTQRIIIFDENIEKRKNLAIFSLKIIFAL